MSYKKQLYGEKSLTKDAMNGKVHALMLGFLTKI
jgi:hypothetical protein